MNTPGVARGRAMSIVLLGPMFVSSLLALLGVIAIMVLIAPKFQTIVADFNLVLSPLQTTFYRVADAVRGTGGSRGLWVFIVPLIIVLSIAIGLMTLVPGTRVLGRFLVLIMFLIAIVLVGVTIYSCYSPLISLMENLATNANGTI